MECMQEDEDDQQQASATKRSRVAIGECSSFVSVGLPPGSPFKSASCSNRRVIAPHPQAPPPLPLPPPPTLSSSSSSSSDWQHKALWLEHRAQAEGGLTTILRGSEGKEEDDGGVMMMAMEEEGLGSGGGGGGESSTWAPLPPRRRRGQRSRASSIEMMTS